MSAVNRERRKNAGKRMAILGKKMAEEDDAFWSHDTWADDQDSGNESFHESDEDSALQKDVFDSDFNDSESDNEDDEVAAGEAEERELRKAERMKRSNIKSSADLSTLGGQKRRRGFPVGSKRILGEGFNAGIVLNLPPESYDSLAYSASIAANRSALEQLTPTPTTQQSTSMSLESSAAATDTKTTHSRQDNNSLEPPIVPPITSSQSTTTISSTAAAPVAATKPKPIPARKQTRSSRLALRDPPSTQGRKLRGNTTRATSRRGASSTTPTTATASSARKSSSTNTGSDTSSRVSAAAKRKRYAQEELLLEAVHETEPENQRWLHGRKRVQDQYNRDKDSNAGLRDRYRGKKVIQKFHSRRGCLITLTFPEMDSVPEILTRRQPSTKLQDPPVSGAHQEGLPAGTTPPFSNEVSQQQQQKIGRCVITGKAGKYKDPLTKYPYHDLAAFRELRRRHKNGIEIVNNRVVTNGSKCDGGREGSNKKKAPSTTSLNNSISEKRTSQGGKNKQPKTIVGNASNKKTTTMNRQDPKKFESSAISAHQKLPFQSPKPPPRPSTNGSSNLPKTSGGPKAHTPDGIMLSLTKSTNSPVSPSGRRLSPRKWKPSEKILETLAMMPGTDTAVPRGLGIQPLVTSSLSSDQFLDNGKNINTGGSTNPVITGPSPPAASERALASKPLPPDNHLCPSTEGSNQTTENISIVASTVNGGSNAPTRHAMSQHSGTVQTPVTQSSVSMAFSHSKGNVATDSSHAKVLATSGSNVDTTSLARKIQEQKSSSDVVIKTKLEDSTPNQNASIAAAGDKKTNANA